MIALYSFVLALFVSTALVPLLVRVAAPLGLLDMPGGRKVHANPIPRVGGIAIVLGVVVSMLVWLPPRPDLFWFLAATAVLFVFGVWDDRADIDYRLKFFGQIAAALVMVLGGDLAITRLPFTFDTALPGYLGVPLTVLVIVAVTNAVNLSDGLDGLAGGMSLLAIAALGLLAYLGDDRVTALLAIVVVGGILGFLRHNTYPARVFMGDTGSQFLGFSAAVLALTVTEKANPALSCLVPLVVLALPLWDTAHVMVRRIAQGRSPFSPDRGHFHHRLLDLGLNQYEAVAVIYLVNFVLFGAALALAYAADGLVLAVFLGFGAAMVGGLWLAGVLVRRGDAAPWRIPLVRRVVEYAKANATLRVVPLRVIGVVLPLLLLAGTVLAPAVSRDIGWMALLLGSVLFVALLVRAVPFFTFERLGAYLAGILVVFLIETGEGAVWLTWGLHAAVLVLTLALAVWVRFAGQRAFQVNTLDLLVIFVVALVPQLPMVAEASLGLVALQALAVIYAAELLMVERQRCWDPLRISVLLGLGVLAVRGLVL